MKVFHCDHCRHLVFFENVQCLKCGHVLAYLPDLRVVGSLDAGEKVGIWKSPISRASGTAYRLCRNYTDYNVCNWAIPADDMNTICSACQLTHDIPDLSVPANAVAWYRLEVAKRRLVYTLDALRLSTSGLSFHFLADPIDPAAPRVLTGHADGKITVNLAEADDAERERRRTSLNEPYRTLLGHMRHESGHFYFDRLIATSEERLAEFRSLFGDERLDYQTALQRHYETGAPPNWIDNYVSAYATMHPWEDWAETWAHYLHMVDTMETANACGLFLAPSRGDEPTLETAIDPLATSGEAFEALMTAWLSVTYALNNLNRGLGQADAYPFVLSQPVIEKIRYIHDRIAAAAVV